MEGISRFVDFHLSQLVRSLLSYIKDTTDFLTKLDAIKHLPSGMILATIDVKALYTNIPHNKGIEACRIVLETREVQQPPTQGLTHLIKLILTRNNFVFDEEHYLQLMGQLWGLKWLHRMQICLWED